ncbi:MAG: hypothetical protein RLZZ224_997, partial [Verrucomicrobiota bacterium]
LLKISWQAWVGLLVCVVNEMNAALSGVAMKALLSAFGAALLVLLLGIGMMRRRLRESEEMPPAMGWGDLVRTWWVRPVDVAGLVVISGMFMTFGVSALVMSGGDLELTSAGLVSNAILFVGFVGVLWAMVSWRARPAEWLGLRWRQWYHVLWFAPLVVLGMWLVMGVLQACGYLAWMEKWAGAPSMQESVELMKESKDVTAVALMAISAAVVAPLAEELIFRGYLYPVAKKWSGKHAALIFSAMWFSACHGNVPLILPLFLLGLILAIAYEKTGSIWAPMGIHFFFNSATVIIQLAIRAGWIPDVVAS